MRRIVGIAIGGAALASCAPRAPAPPIAKTTPVASTVAPTATFSVPRPDPTKPPTVFQVLAPMRFKPGKGAAKLKLVHPEREHVVMAPDGSTMLASFGNEATIF